MEIRYYDMRDGRMHIKRHYKYLFWAAVIGVAALVVAGKLHGH